MDTKILKTSDYKTSHWSGGTTTQILIYPEGSTLEKRDFVFRVSSATCGDGLNKFSDFTGYNRYITSLDKDLLLINKGEEKLLKPYEILFFDGEDDTASNSAVRDFNLIIEKGVTGSLRSESILGGVTLKIFGGVNLIYIPEGNLRATIKGETINLEVGNSILAYDDEIVLETIEEETTRILIVEAEVD